jgi:hypothetical protein
LEIEVAATADPDDNLLLRTSLHPGGRYDIIAAFQPARLPSRDYARSRTGRSPYQWLEDRGTPEGGKLTWMVGAKIVIARRAFSHFACAASLPSIATYHCSLQHTVQPLARLQTGVCSPS